ncbi:MAG: sialate O-acetylesterase [Phycisphaeraceae bacterium]
MKSLTRVLTIFTLLLVSLPCLADDKAKQKEANGKLKVFVLAGQSNMVGFGTVLGDKPGTMQTAVKNEPDKYGHLVKDGDPIVRKDVYVVNLSAPGKQKEAGFLDTNFGAGEGLTGPEYGFGWVVGEYFEDPVLIIKCSWGGRSLKHNFLPPSIEDYPKPQKDGDMGFHYAEVVRHVKEVTGNLKKYVPGYKGKGFEIVGFGWHQGWNDSIDQSAVDVYERNLVAFIKDIRKDLGVIDMPFVCANTGMRGWKLPDRYRAKVEKHVEAQLAPGNTNKYPEFAGNFAGVETRGFAFTKEQSPSGQEFHWNRNWVSYYLIGNAMGKAMVDMIAD